MDMVYSTCPLRHDQCNPFSGRRAAPSAASAQASCSNGVPMNVLLIDDDRGLRKSLRLALEMMDHHVAEARDGAQAQALVGHTTFDVTFLDLRLGREQGLDVLPALLRLRPGLT